MVSVLDLVSEWGLSVRYVEPLWLSLGFSLSGWISALGRNDRLH